MVHWLVVGVLVGIVVPLRLLRNLLLLLVVEIEVQLWIMALRYMRYIIAVDSVVRRS